MNCSNCGAELREGAAFCSACGTPVARAVFCANCGAELSAGDKFCYACGAPVRERPATAPAPAAASAAGKEAPAKRPGRPPKSAAAAPESTAVNGFYFERGRRCCASNDEMIVFRDSDKLRRLDRNMDYRENDAPCWTGAVALRGEEILCLYPNERMDADTEFKLLTYDRDLHAQGQSKQIYSISGADNMRYGMALTPNYALVTAWVEDEEDMSDSVSLFRYDLETGESSEHDFTAADFGYSARLCLYSSQHPLMYAGKFYLEAGAECLDEDGDPQRTSFTAEIDTVTWTVTVLWRENEDSDRPVFFDFAKNVMWTNPREGEAKRRGWSRSELHERLVARRIGYKQPILPNYPVWTATGIGSSPNFYYFDGKRCYFAYKYYSFKAVAQDGTCSEDWCKTSHGRTEETVVWREKELVIADLDADYYFTVYPASFEKEPDYQKYLALHG